jgi:hypothetical protein
MAEETEQKESQASADSDEKEDRRERMKQIEEEGPPQDLKDWPDDDLKYETFGGPEGDHSYEEGPEKQLGPSNLRHREDGQVEIDGEEVDDPEEYKGDPIPGGPTDPNASGPDVDNGGDEDDSERESKDDEDS